MAGELRRSHPTLRRFAVTAGVSAAVCASTLFMSGCRRSSKLSAVGKPEPLLCYVGGTMRPVMEMLAEAYEKDTGQPVTIDYSGSGQLLIKIETTGIGDLYVCHDPFLNALMRKGLGLKGYTIAAIKPMIAVAKGNPKQIKGLADLTRPGLKVGLTDEMFSTVGHINKVMFRKAGLAEAIKANVVTRSRSGGQVANAVKLGHLDAAIVWNAVIFVRRDALDAVEIEDRYRPQPGVDAVTSPTWGPIDMSRIRVTLATLKCSKQPKAAAQFAEYVTSAKARAVFLANGFLPAEAGPTPAKRLRLYCGAGIRPPVAELIEAFKAATGVQVECDYAGSGVLLSRMQLAKAGDLYMPGDVSYIEAAAAKGLVESIHPVCYFVPVIMVQKGNPKQIKGLTDLTRPGLRVGLGRPDACAVGQQSAKIFAKNGIDLAAIQKNLTFSSLTVNELGIQIKTGHLDAAIVWDATAAYYQDSAEAVAIPVAQNVVSKVALSVLNFSEQKGDAQKFVTFVTGPAGKAVFSKHHYTTDEPQ